MPNPTSGEPYILSDAYFADVGRIADSGLEHRNQMIEWAHGIVAAVLVGVLITQNYSLLTAWLAAGFVSVFLTPLFSLAVTEHSYFLRYNAARRALLLYRLARDADPTRADRAELERFIGSIEVGKSAVFRRFDVVRDVLLMGYGYLLVASYGAFTLLTVKLATTTNWAGSVASFQAEGWLELLVVVGFVIAMVREYRYLWTNRILDPKPRVVPIPHA